MLPPLPPLPPPLIQATLHLLVLHGQLRRRGGRLRGTAAMVVPLAAGWGWGWGGEERIKFERHRWQHQLFLYGPPFLRWQWREEVVGTTCSSSPSFSRPRLSTLLPRRRWRRGSGAAPAAPPCGLLVLGLLAAEALEVHLAAGAEKKINIFYGAPVTLNLFLRTYLSDMLRCCFGRPN